MAKIKIAIDAGHGSDTAGKRTPPFTKDVDINSDGSIDIKKGTQYREHYANVGVAQFLYNKLVSRGYDVIKTGWDDANATNDADTSLSSRQSQIKKYGCDYSVSIHFNAYGDGKSFNAVKGVSIYIHPSEHADSLRLAEFTLKELTSKNNRVNRGIHSSNLAMCNCTSMKTKASILCELAFMTNEKEAMELMANKKFWEESAEQIADAIDRYCNCNNPEVITKNGTISVYHTVTSGETLSEIAADNSTTIEQLISLNKIKNPNVIKVGQKLLIRKYVKYTFQKGDTLTSLAKKYLGDASRYKEIIELNNLKNDTVYAGQILKIPSE